MATSGLPLPLARVAASECLLGRRVRWDGDHNGDVWPRQLVARLFDLVGLCPEVGIGLGAPRPPIRLVGDPAQPRATGVTDASADFTDRLRDYAKRVAPTLGGVSGYIFADRSPSCGLNGVKVYDDEGNVRRVGRGIYAAAVVAARPELPVVDAETLADEGVLRDFVAAVVARQGGEASRGDIERAIAAAHSALGA